jgi:hypothetical protein
LLSQKPILICRTRLSQKSVLEAHGFVAILFDWHVGSVNWSYMFALNGIRLCTLDVSLSDALRLLDERLETEDPNLGTTVRVIDILIALFAFFYAGLPYPVRRKRYRNIQASVIGGRTDL